MSALYDGVVVHRRFAPRVHRLRYRLFQLLLDLDELPTLDRGRKLFGHNRFALFSHYDRDHGDRSGRPLRGQIGALLKRAGLSAGGGPIRLLAMPRVLGYVFNPLSLYYCHRPTGELAAVVLEVNNTFGERHFYVAPAEGGMVRTNCAKALFVSPLMGMDMSYDFRLAAPGETAEVAILGRDGAGAPLIFARFAGRRRPLTDRALLGAFFAHPLLTLKVIAAIHLEAAKLIAKGIRLRPKPTPQVRAITVASAAPAANDDRSPLPLEGRGRGWGAGTSKSSVSAPLDARSQSRRAPYPQPLPLGGEGA